MHRDNEFVEFITDGHRFFLSQYKVNIIYRNIDDIKEYWSAPIDPYGEYRIQPSNRRTQWHISEIHGYKLDYILRNALDINRRLDGTYRLPDSVLRNVLSVAQQFISQYDSTATHEFRHGLYPWQKEALETWYLNKGKRGIIEAATGTGKTLLAMVCMEKFFRDSPNGLVCIVVPRQPIFSQWQEWLLDHFQNMTESNYCYNGNGHHAIITKETRILITTQQAMVLKEDSNYGCTLLGQLDRSGRDILIVFDEAHHLGATQTLERFTKHIPDRFFTLGLSATPYRQDGVMSEVYRYFDCDGSESPIYSYPLTTAVEDGILSKVIQKNYSVSLTADEEARYEQFREEITILKNRISSNGIITVDRDQINHGSIFYLALLKRRLLEKAANDKVNHERIYDLIKKIDSLQNIYVQRRRLFNKAEHKWALLKRILKSTAWKEQLTSGRWIIFHEEIEECQKTAQLLMDALGQERIRLHHAGMTIKERQAVLTEFDKNQFNCLCAVHTLDEGIDVPDLTGIIIVSGSASQRQQIQRCGRALRRAPNKDCAYLVSFLAQGDDDLTGEKLLIGPDSSTARWIIEEHSY